jgi:hypothetical protein
MELAMCSDEELGTFMLPVLLPIDAFAVSMKVPIDTLNERGKLMAAEFLRPELSATFTTPARHLSSNELER